MNKKTDMTDSGTGSGEPAVLLSEGSMGGSEEPGRRVVQPHEAALIFNETSVEVILPDRERLEVNTSGVLSAVGIALLFRTDSGSDALAELIARYMFDYGQDKDKTEESDDVSQN